MDLDRLEVVDRMKMVLQVVAILVVHSLEELWHQVEALTKEPASKP
jgi:hypothetical protein